MRQYSGEQETDWPAVDYAPMPGLKLPDDYIPWELSDVPPWELMEHLGQPYQIHVPAMRCALGLEPTPEAYIGHLVLVFREVWRVMRDDAVMWCVIGDSFGPEGQLLMVPHRLALALQADRWTIRNDPVFSKVAPMPDSVAGTRWQRCRVKVATMQGGHGNLMAQTTHWRAGFSEDARTEWRPCPGCPRCEATGGYVLRRGSCRHTRAHETVIMAVKSMGYYADQERVRESLSDATLERNQYSRLAQAGTKSFEGRQGNNTDGRTRPSVDFVNYEPKPNPSGRNPRTNLTADDELWAAFLSWYYSAQDGNPPGVLTPKPENYSKSHYAVYPSGLIAPLIRATCPTRCCPVCGAGYAPVVEIDRPDDYDPSIVDPVSSQYHRKASGQPGTQRPLSKMFADSTGTERQVTGYRATCSHDAEPVPGWVLDPFCGSGTTLQVARELGLNACGLDISMDYLDAHVKPRINLTPSNALDDLPLFEFVDKMAEVLEDATPEDREEAAHWLAIHEVMKRERKNE